MYEQCARVIEYTCCALLISVMNVRVSPKKTNIKHFTKTAFAHPWTYFCNLVPFLSRLQKYFRLVTHIVDQIQVMEDIIRDDDGGTRNDWTCANSYAPVICIQHMVSALWRICFRIAASCNAFPGLQIYIDGTRCEFAMLYTKSETRSLIVSRDHICNTGIEAINRQNTRTPSKVVLQFTILWCVGTRRMCKLDVCIRVVIFRGSDSYACRNFSLDAQIHNTTTPWPRGPHPTSTYAHLRPLTSLASLFAPASSSILTTSMWPADTAVCSGVFP